MSTLTPEQVLGIEQACERQIRRFAAFNDAHQHDRLAALFTEDGSFARPTEPDVLISGRIAILEFFNSRPTRLTRHLMCNTVVTVKSQDEATADSTVVLYMGEETATPPRIAATLVGAFADTLQKVEGQWLFKARRGSLAMKA